jgi:uncharacterized protein YfeS
MAFDIEQALRGKLTVHPDARRCFSEGSALLFTLDIGPLESDRGSDAISEFLRWREANPTATLGTCLRWITDSFAVDYHAGLSGDAVIDEQLAREEAACFEWDDQVYALDETIIASALTQVIVEGRVDDDAMGIVAIALARAAHPLVLARSFGHADDLRRQAVAEAKAVLDAAAARRERASTTPAPHGVLPGAHVARLRRAVSEGQHDPGGYSSFPMQKEPAQLPSPPPHEH